MARRRKGPLKKALAAMRPDRVLFRALSGPEVVSAVRSKTATRTTRVTAQTRQAQVQRAAKKTTAKKAAGKPDPYAAALAIPGQNRQTAAKMAKAAQPQAGKKQVAVRKRNGQFDGSKVMADRDRTAWQAAVNGQVDPSLLPRTPRRR